MDGIKSLIKILGLKTYDVKRYLSYDRLEDFPKQFKRRLQIFALEESPLAFGARNIFVQVTF